MRSRSPLLVLAATLATTAPCAAGDGLVALQTGDPSCGNGTGAIYVPCGNGTVTDNRTGLIWLQNADCFGQRQWADAVDLVANLSDIPSGSAAAADDCGLSDGSSPGEWRLPTAAEWEAMIDDANGGAGDLDCTAGDAPTITNDAGTMCHSADPSSFTSIDVTGVYWSATFAGGDPAYAWRVILDDGLIESGDKALFNRVWPVRGGQ